MPKNNLSDTVMIMTFMIYDIKINYKDTICWETSILIFYEAFEKYC